jgi:protein-arginine kinase activator protein McsA
MHEMKGFVDKIITELKTNSKLKSEPLVKMLSESVDKSISLGESELSIYHNLKTGIASVNAKLKDKTLSVILEQFTRLENTPETQVDKIARKVNLLGKISAIKESKSAANPIIKHSIDLFESYLNSGTPDFALCESFISTFSAHEYDSVIKKQVNSVKNYLNESRSALLFLNAIYTMDSMPNQTYSAVSSDLKNLLINESYTSDILKIKYGNSVPLVNQLISDLRLLESQKMGYFTLGEGDSFTKITNLIAPATKAKDGLIVYMDDRFVSIRESKGLTGKETSVYIDDTFKIAEIDPNYVKEKFPKFYSVAESYATLGFKKNLDGTGVDSGSIRNFNISFKTNEEKELDLYLNEAKIENLDQINITEALALEDASVKQRVMNLFENSENLFNFDFIKELSNDRTMSEALVLKLNSDYFVCEKLNAVERDWRKIDEFALYEFCMKNFQYDISPIFKTKIDETVESYKKIEEKKKEINIDIEKLNTVMEKLQAAISNPDLDSEAIKKLEGLRESVESTINSLKHDYVGLDLFKRDIQ